MKKITYYQCDYCKCKTSNYKKFQNHEEYCKFLTFTQNNAKSRILSLIEFYEKQGYRITINYSTTGGQMFINVYHPDYGKFK